MSKHNLATAVPRAVVALAALAIASSFSNRAIAQESYPSCEPPDAGEYLLLVQGDADTAKAALAEALPDVSDITVCNYLDSVITRVGGFSDADTATAWAQYLSDMSDLEAYVARPPHTETEPAPEETSDPEAEADTEAAPSTEEESSSEAAPSEAPAEAPGSAEDSPSNPERKPEEREGAPEATDEPAESSSQSAAPSESAVPSDEAAQQADATPEASLAFPTPSILTSPNATLVADTETTDSPNAAPAATPTEAIAATPTYSPKVLGDGYAVLVEYFNQPDIAANVQESIGSGVGLASYNQQPYLLVAHTANGAEASTIVSNLSSDFRAMLVDSRNVVLISPAIAITP